MSKNYIVIATLVYRIEADNAEDAKDITRATTDNPADMEGVFYLTGDYIVEEEGNLL